MVVIYEVDRHFLLENLKFLKNKDRVAEWLALRTSKRRDSGSIPAEVKTFFGGFNSLEQYIALNLF